MESEILFSKEVVKNIIAQTLDVSPNIITDDLSIGDIPEWDSLGHIKIVSAIEQKMGAALDIEQIIEIEDVEDIFALINGDNIE